MASAKCRHEEKIGSQPPPTPWRRMGSACYPCLTMVIHSSIPTFKDLVVIFCCHLDLHPGSVRYRDRAFIHSRRRNDHEHDANGRRRGPRLGGLELKVVCIAISRTAEIWPYLRFGLSWNTLRSLCPAGGLESRSHVGCLAALLPHARQALVHSARGPAT